MLTNNLKLAVLIVLALASFISCTKNSRETPNVDLIQNMMEMPSYKAQEFDPEAKNGSSMRVPPAGTVPRGYYPYAFDDTENGRNASSSNANPLPRTSETMKRGQIVFNTYCIVCHGARAEGNGTVTGAGRFPMPPTLHSDKIRHWSDGRIYHVITKGQNVMPSYAGQIRPMDRWAVIHYVRALQRANNPTPEDVKEFTAQGENK